MKKIIIVLVSVFTIFSSCEEKFIDLSSPTALSPEKYYKNQTEIENALTGAYAILRTYYSPTVYPILAEYPSDNTQTVAQNETGYGNLDKLSWTVNTEQIGSIWNVSYNAIARCNAVIHQIEPITFTNAALKIQYTSEAKFLRALMYFNLTRFFGEVPLVLEKIETEEEAYTFKRETLDKIYAQIIQDLMDAESGLPASYTGANIGRATKGAVQALLGKVYLQQKNWPAAVTTLKKVIDSGTYTLLPTYADVFLASNNNNKEIVFAVQFTGGTMQEGSNYFIDFLPQQSGTTIVSTGGAPGSLNLGTQDLFDAFETGDLRKNTAIRLFTSGSTSLYYTYKFYENVARGEGNQDWPVIRYADVLLMYSEALAENNQISEALLPSSANGSSINKVRNRAGLPELAGTLTKSELQSAVEKERRVELCFEGHRWFDLTRTQRMVPVMMAFKSKYKVTALQVDENSGFKSLFPIPFRERQLNPNITQNPGYSD